jgi:hypothetical protein
MMRSFAIFGALFCVLPAFGGTIVTTGLPSGDAIVNISGIADGTASYDPTQTNFYSPFNVNGHLLEYTVQAETYSFRIVNPTDATSLFPALSAAQLDGVYTGWTYNVPWATDYMVFDSSAASNPAESQIFAGAVMRNVPGANGFIGGGYDNASDAYAAAKLGGYDDQIVSGPGGRYNGTTGFSYTFSQPETLIFAVPDNILSDNTGGVSVLISGAATSTAAPEPASALLLLGGFAGLVFLQTSRVLRRRL